MKVKYIGQRNVYTELGGYAGLLKNNDVIEVADGTVFDFRKFEPVEDSRPAKRRNKKEDCCTVE